MSRLSQVPLFALVATLPMAALAETPLTVAIVAAETAPAAILVEITGAIEPIEAVPVGFRNGGRVVSVEVSVGDSVVAGQALAAIDPVQAEAAALAAGSQLDAADAQLRQAEQARERAAGMLSRGVGAQAELDAATEALMAAQAGRDVAAAGLAKARQAVDDTVIRAPVAGTVTARAAETGQIVGAAQSVVTLARDGMGEAVFHAPELAGLDGFLGQEVDLRLLDQNGGALRGRVSDIAPLVDATTGTVEMRVSLEGARDVGLGAPVATGLTVDLGPAVTLPASAIAMRNGGPAVWLVDPATSRVELRSVEVLRHRDATVEIGAGLSDGDRVVAAGSYLLYPGRPVTEAKP